MAVSRRKDGARERRSSPSGDGAVSVAAGWPAAVSAVAGAGAAVQAIAIAAARIRLSVGEPRLHCTSGMRAAPSEAQRDRAEAPRAS